jgi:hypothetical protein
MNFAVAAGCHSSRAAPFLRDTPAATYYTTTRQRLHLSTAKRCADKAGHLSFPVGGSLAAKFLKRYALSQAVRPTGIRSKIILY